MTMNLPAKPSRIDFEAIDLTTINRILSTGSTDSLTPEEREYYQFMEMVRGLRARMLLPGGRKVVTKAGIIKLLKNNYGLSDWMARRIYDDAINFFYAESAVTSRAWANLSAEKREKMADMAFVNGHFKEGRALMKDAAKLRGCFDDAAPEIPEELLQPKTAVIYTADATALGAPAADRQEVEAFIDEIPEIPEITRRRVKEDAGVLKKNLLKRMIEDVKEFVDETD